MEFAAWVAELHAGLDAMTYQQLLGVADDADAAAVRDAYYRLAARLHPDRHGTLAAPLRAQLVSVYSRVVEAYRVLTSDTRRERYQRLRAEGKLRWTADEERAPGRRDSTELDRLPPSAQRFVKMGRAALDAGDARSAVMNLKLALSVAPESEIIKALLARAEAAL